MPTQEEKQWIENNCRANGTTTFDASLKYNNNEIELHNFDYPTDHDVANYVCSYNGDQKLFDDADEMEKWMHSKLNPKKIFKD